MGKPQTRLDYMPGLDGVRALAVMAVFFYHAGVPWMTGGFLGVESFFVISGFLITSLLLLERARHGRIDLARFWRRRALRLLPALWAMLAGVSLATWLLAPATLGRLGEDALAAFIYISNWVFIFRQVPYFETFDQPVLQHLWSLAVEEQVYLIWPLALLGLMRATRGVTYRLAGLLVVGAVASTVWMALLHEPYGDPSRVYFGTDTRLSGFLIGAALAVVWAKGAGPQPQPASPAGVARWPTPLDGIGVLALIALLSLYGRVQDFDPQLYRGGFALTAVLTAIVIVAATRPHAVLARALGTRPLRWIGARSYGIYLWHWPVMVLARPWLSDQVPFVIEVGVYALVSLALATASFRWVEEPLRQMGWRAWVARWTTPVRARQLATGVAGCVALVALMQLQVRPQQAVAEVGISEVPASPTSIASPTFEVTSEVPASPTPIASPTFEVTSEVPASPTPIASPTFEVTSEVTCEVTSEVPASPTPVASPIFEVTSEVPASPTPQPAPVEALPTPTPVVAPTQVAPASAPEVTMIGDSVMLSTEYVWARRYPGRYLMDAAVGRRLDEAPAVIDTLAQRGQLLPTVVLHLGSNRMFDPALLDQVVQQLLSRGVQRILIVNLRRPANWVPSANANIGAIVSQYPQTQLVDWWALSYDRNDWFIADGTHPTGEGMGRYIDAIAAALWP